MCLRIQLSNEGHPTLVLVIKNCSEWTPPLRWKGFCNKVLWIQFGFGVQKKISCNKHIYKQLIELSFSVPQRNLFNVLPLILVYI